MKTKADIKCAIFDMDGTLTDSMSIWEEAGAIYLGSKGITPRPEWREDTRPMSMHQIAEYFKREYNIDDDMETVMADIDHVVEDYYENVAVAKEYTLEFLEALKTNGIHICLATATDEYLAEMLLKRTGIYPYLEKIYTCSRVGSGKDHPEIFYIAAEAFGAKPSECVVFEDAYYALKTAHDAGFNTVSVYDITAADCDAAKREIADVSIMSFCELLYPDN